MIVPYPLNKNKENNLSTTIITHRGSLKPLIRFNLNIIQCSNKNLLLNWTSIESSSTLNGEFVRTKLLDTNIMYLSSGRTYLKNLTTIDCSTKTLYRTDHKQIFKLDLRIQSTLNDYCSYDNSCYPLENYQCNQTQHRCICRKPLQSYSIHDQYPICIQVVEYMDQCTMKNIQCLEWCHQNSSSTMCTCPDHSLKKRSLDDDRAYCESRTGEICNSLIQCSSNDICVRGICQNINYKSYRSISFKIVTILIITSFLFLFMVSFVLGISTCILRRQRWKKEYRSIDISFCTKRQEETIPDMSNYDNVTHRAFRNNNIQLSTSDDHDSSPMTTSDDCSYEPKIVYLGGEQQLTAIFA